ncbi:10159_t:CDS:2, partial [Dentiscutata heterogama]
IWESENISLCKEYSLSGINGKGRLDFTIKQDQNILCVIEAKALNGFCENAKRLGLISWNFILLGFAFVAALDHALASRSEVMVLGHTVIIVIDFRRYVGCLANFNKYNKNVNAKKVIVSQFCIISTRLTLSIGMCQSFEYYDKVRVLNRVEKKFYGEIDRILKKKTDDSATLSVIIQIDLRL